MDTLTHKQTLDSGPGVSSQDDWTGTFREIYEQAVKGYEKGLREIDQVVGTSKSAFLDSIGMSPQELYDFVEDWVDAGEPSFEEVLRITQLRREYLLKVQKGQPSTRVLSENDFPSGHATLGGYRWLPRIIAKANAKLRGELLPDLMYSCGGDRGFLRPLGIKPSEFLEKVWQYEGQEDRMVEYVQNYGKEHKT